MVIFAGNRIAMKFRMLVFFCWVTTFFYAQQTADLFLQPTFYPVKTMTSMSDSVTLVRHEGYISQMHNGYHLPLWVYHRISKQLLDEGVKQKRPSGYPADAAYPSLKRTFYGGSGYQHGHLAPAADFKQDEQLYIESHFMTNMAPQHGCLNEIGWCYLESMTRNWAAEDSTTVTHVVSGCIPGKWIDTLCYPSGMKIYVPASFFKAVFIEDTLHPERSRAIGFIVKNDYLSKEAAQQAICSIDSIERITNLDLFSGCTRLNPAQLESTEKNVGAFRWKGYKTECGGKKCESVYSGNRIHPSKRKKLLCD